MTGESAETGSNGRRGGGRSQARRILLWVAAAAIVCLSSTLGYRAQRKVQHDQAFCTGSCHHQNDAGMAGAHAIGHKDVECQTCHKQSLGKGLTLLWQSITHSKAPTKHGHVDAASCKSCHDKLPGESLVAHTHGHREHEGKKGVDCISCHGSTTHKADAPEKTCVKCHSAARLHKPSTVADAETCLTCHSYSANKASQPSALACERCHADSTKVAASAGNTPRSMKEVNQHALHGGVGCELCHNPHGKKPKLPEGQPACVQCHQFQIFEVGKEQKKGPAEHFKCEGCHKPHAPKNSALDSCVNCHEKNATGVVANIASNNVSGSSTALRHKSCASCHLPHAWRAERSGCVQCHDDKAKLLLNRSPPQHNACTQCHSVHGPPPTGAVCVDCHKKTKGNHVALAPQKHKDCTSCHNPHAPLPQDTRASCAKCHTVQLTQLMRDGPEGHTKGTCFGCHQPHDNPKPPPTLCAKCHGERAVLVATAGPAKHKLCMSCHEEHKFKIKDPTATCSKCHTKTFQLASLGAKVPHQGDCKNCHMLHGPPNVAKAACLKCHDKVAAALKAPNEKHATCRSCHEPHKPAASAVSACATCHANKSVVAAKWPAESAHAKACNGCHQQHDVKTKKACADCHGKEAGSAMGGKHQCQQCHPPHNAPPGTGKAWWSRCNECHANKVTAVKDRGPKHAACDNCHKPHKFDPPPCNSCHKMGSKGLHAVAKHDKCTACHDAHTKGEPTPKQCLACHTNKTNHEPNAKKCQACHMFQ